ncbi:hypothetical protein STCU_11059 [Strigomonas culicis]|uniref:Surface antigen-like protein n=1 Tax=Strigomonas culicis TaxID=28005 RepID=S9TF52_9TRYP|nr:hypothetical protein STCU_11059 [Strigomonas culicis]|eukprot:EPY16672.1 hypothetical protein STCU_11059 [Strigomonas culicis]
MQRLTLVVLFAVLLFVYDTVAMNCPDYTFSYSVLLQICLDCPARCRMCTDAFSCLPGYCDADTVFSNNLCYSPNGTDAAGHTIVYAVAAVLCTTVLAWCY